MLSPGHTLASVTYVAGDAAFVHDTLMMPAAGSSREDFPGGDAGMLWDSIRAILDLPAETRLFVGHDYPAEGAEPSCMADRLPMPRIILKRRPSASTDSPGLSSVPASIAWACPRWWI